MNINDFLTEEERKVQEKIDAHDYDWVLHTGAPALLRSLAAARALVEEKDKALLRVAETAHGLNGRHDGYIFRECPEYPCPVTRIALALTEKEMPSDE